MILLLYLLLLLYADSTGGRSKTRPGAQGQIDLL